jgi:hypothetical protein
MIGFLVTSLSQQGLRDIKDRCRKVFNKTSVLAVTRSWRTGVGSLGVGTTCMGFTPCRGYASA